MEKLITQPPVQALWHGVASPIVVGPILLGVGHHVLEAAQKLPGATDEGGVDLLPRDSRLGLKCVEILVEMARAANCVGLRRDLMGDSTLRWPMMHLVWDYVATSWDFAPG